MTRLHRPCPLCGVDNRSRPKSRYSKGEWLIKECPECSFVYIENPTPYSELVENLAWEKTHARETDFGLKEVLKGAGFSIEKFSFQDRLPTSDNMWLVASKPEGR